MVNESCCVVRIALVVMYVFYSCRRSEKVCAGGFQSGIHRARVSVGASSVPRFRRWGAPAMSCGVRVISNNFEMAENIPNSNKMSTVFYGVLDLGTEFSRNYRRPSGSPFNLILISNNPISNQSTRWVGFTLHCSVSETRDSKSIHDF